MSALKKKCSTFYFTFIDKCLINQSFTDVVAETLSNDYFIAFQKYTVFSN